ncbi:cyclopropane-fatty-acyl-phospholipid synthase family protein [Octadecabacter sp.]|nr:cyclopropane-fatty-acyl-phospholipid synthase family protein [Octadecabacter sp.]
MLEQKLSQLFKRTVDVGTLEVTYPSGNVQNYGDGTLEKLHIRFVDDDAMKKLYSDPELQFPELYMHGKLVIEEGNIYDLVLLSKLNRSKKKFVTPPAAVRTAGRILQRKMKRTILPDASKRNVAHHYDLDEKLFRLFLDKDMQYSCGYFENGDETLEEAQLKKKRHIAAKMRLKEGQRILDIGCGWGGMGLYLAKTTGAHVTGVSLSEEQVRVANERAAAAGLSDRAQFKLMDYRKVTGEFDRVVSVGMFEHVGLRHYNEFFSTVKKLMTDDGVFLLHSIVRPKPNRYSAPFVEKYIFPQGQIPSLGETLAEVEKVPLLVKDVEILTYHYADTILEWRERFRANKDKVLELYDETFFRMWDVYLTSSEIQYRHGRLCNFQIQFVKQNSEGPRNRNYIAEAEAALKLKE